MDFDFVNLIHQKERPLSKHPCRYFLYSECTGGSSNRSKDQRYTRRKVAEKIIGDASVGEVGFAPDDESPRAIVARSIDAFCASGHAGTSDDEVLHLPPLVDAAESSPAAAAQAAEEICRRLVIKPSRGDAHIQYKAIMLLRILVDNPGPSFTRGIDQNFVTVIKDLLCKGRDVSVHQLLRETLEAFAIQKKDDVNLHPLLSMWDSQKQVSAASFPISGANVPTHAGLNQGVRPDAPMSQHPGPAALPAPPELAQRIEEARTSAKLLGQVVQTTPHEDMFKNELISEFAQRCQTASRAIQNYINATNPAPDEDTLLTLIETNDQLAAAISRHQRAVLQARRLQSSSRVPTVASSASLAGQGRQVHRSATGSPAPAPAPRTTQLPEDAGTRYPDNNGPPRAGLNTSSSNPFDDNAALHTTRHDSSDQLQAPLIPLNHAPTPPNAPSTSSREQSVPGIGQDAGHQDQTGFPQAPTATKPRYRF